MRVDHGHISIGSKRPLVVLLPNGKTVVVEDGDVTVDTEFSGLDVRTAPIVTLTFTAECSKYILISNGGYKRYKRYKEKLRREKLKNEHNQRSEI